MLVGGGAQAGGGDAGMIQFAGMAHIPGLQAVGGDFGMELQGQGEAADGEGLMGVAFCPGQMERAGGQVKGIAMPVKDGERGREERGEPFGRIEIRRGLERRPADLFSIEAGIDARAEGGGHELRAQADSENGLAGGKALGDEGDFIFEKRVFLVVIDADGTTENDEKVAGRGLRQGEGGLRGVDVLDFKASRAERGFEGAKVFEGYVAEDEGAGSVARHESSLRGDAGVGQGVVLSHPFRQEREKDGARSVAGEIGKNNRRSFDFAALRS